MRARSTLMIIINSQCLLQVRGNALKQRRQTTYSHINNLRSQKLGSPQSILRHTISFWANTLINWNVAQKYYRPRWLKLGGFGGWLHGALLILLAFEITWRRLRQQLRAMAIRVALLASSHMFPLSYCCVYAPGYMHIRAATHIQHAEHSRNVLLLLMSAPKVHTRGERMTSFPWPRFGNHGAFLFLICAALCALFWLKKHSMVNLHIPAEILNFKLNLELCRNLKEVSRTIKFKFKPKALSEAAVILV
jgi:hypothetical protein